MKISICTALLAGVTYLPLLAAPQGTAPGKVSPLPTPTPQQKRGDRPASTASSGASAQSAAGAAAQPLPTPTPPRPGPASLAPAPIPKRPENPSRPNPAGLAPAPVAGGLKYTPTQLDFGAIDYGASSKRTFSLTPPVAGEIILEFPVGSFVAAEVRRVPPLMMGKPQAQLTKMPPIKPAPISSTNQTETYKWSFAAGEEMQLDILFAPSFSKDKTPGLRTATMKLSGPGSTTPWAVSIPMRGIVNRAGLPASDSPQPKSGTTEMSGAATSGKAGSSPANPAGAATPPGEKSAVEQLKLRLAGLRGLKVKSGTRIQNPTSQAAQRPAMSGGVNGGSALSGSANVVSVAQTPPPGQNPGQADPTATLNRSSATVDPCKSFSQKDPTLISIDNQPNQWVFSNEPHTYRFTGCNFGSPQRLLRLHFTDPSSGWTDDLPLAPTSWQNQEILAQVTLELKGGKVVPMPDINSLEIQLIHESIPGKLWVLGNGKFRAVRGNPVLLSAIPQSLITAFPQGSPYVLAPMTNFYGVNGAMGIVRPSLNSLIPLGQDKIKLALKSGFVIDSAQLQYLVYDNQGQGSTATADSSRLTINGNNILVNYPIDSITQNSQTSYYSIYGLRVWVVGPKDIDPWQ